MDLVPVVDAAQKYLAAHPWAVFALGTATGYVTNNIPKITTLVFKAAMKLPPFKAAILANPKRAKEIIDEIETELDKDIDAAVAGEAPAVKAVPAPAPVAKEGDAPKGS